ncbi:MAG: carbohydrate kinase family protein [bacterium]|nr:carbohydrate kinase family protein [bacterium]
MDYDFVSFGDITTDCFIKLKEARVTCDLNDENCMLCVRFGQKIPYESAAEIRSVGNGPNAAVSAHRLGLKSAIVTNLGDDENGEHCLKALQKERISTEFVRVHKGSRTNYHYVLQYESERTILIKHEEYKYELPAFGKAPRWIYLTSLSKTSLKYQLAIAGYVHRNNVRLAFQPGTFQMELGTKALAPVYLATEIFFCNKEEAQKILETKEVDLKKLLSGIRALGPKIAVITDGPKGAYIMDDSGAYSAPMYPDPMPPINRTGAGDATSSTTVAYMMMGMTPQESLLRGIINASDVVQHVGAQAGLLSKAKIEKFYQNRPPEFKISAL